ncbi:hypothetical protein RvY_04933-1 [Ramazzottius varieornatus]|uniref:Uncharacterized protein n=1 Tax=Ramazzottius varieornatus TaxID=947166 RepID=A0A1D1V378_RAMVA|nr:hypothetical protein RvY_04933-1 [Ramazzottius varieornatus]
MPRRTRTASPSIHSPLDVNIRLEKGFSPPNAVVDIDRVVLEPIVPSISAEESTTGSAHHRSFDREPPTRELPLLPCYRGSFMLFLTPRDIVDPGYSEYCIMRDDDAICSIR